ncbi:MAG: acyltransferase [Proteiniphilum sp.]|uniref:acyltransferase n=1 Tax=Proteiniphilum sp. TaxID=1926877 RepID=UPI002AB89295|nr:acyltransferase [Proteiniphilum sp.]MDY9918299.1 acyltransferase [Proteiniphilum sp.]
MRKYFSLIFRAFRFVLRYVKGKFQYIACRIILEGNNVEYKKIVTNGVPFVSVARKGKCVIGDNFHMNNNIRGNPIGRVQRCILFVDNGAELIIGNNVGISSTALIANISIHIGDNVKIGGGVCIYDTDFHSLDSEIRKDKGMDKINTDNKPVIIGNNVFIGAHSTILKGVTVGNNSIIGACSVVTRSIPENEIWAGNPAKFIRKINFD